MKLLIELPTNNLVIDTTDMGPLIGALGSAKPVVCKWEADGTRYEPVDNRRHIEIKVLDEAALAPMPDPIKKLTEEKAVADGRWVEYYTKAGALEAELKALKTDLDKRGISYAQPTLSTNDSPKTSS